MMVFDNAVDDGQPQSCTALLGREIWQEQLFLNRRSDTMAAIGYRNFHYVARPDCCRRDGNFLDHRVLQRLSRIVHKVRNGSLDGIRIGMDCRQIGRQQLLYANPAEPAVDPPSPSNVEP